MQFCFVFCMFLCHSRLFLWVLNCLKGFQLLSEEGHLSSSPGNSWVLISSQSFTFFHSNNKKTMLLSWSCNTGPVQEGSLLFRDRVSSSVIWERLRVLAPQRWMESTVFVGQDALQTFVRESLFGFSHWEEVSLQTLNPLKTLDL